MRQKKGAYRLKSGGMRPEKCLFDVEKDGKACYNETNKSIIMYRMLYSMQISGQKIFSNLFIAKILVSIMLCA